MIRVAIVDDHYAIRIGLTAALQGEVGIEPVGTASNAAELAPLLYSTNPDVIIVDYRLPDVDGLTLCNQIKREALAPAVLIHSAFADDWLVIPALVAGADGIVHKGAPGRELAESIRTVASGRKALPGLDPELLAASSELLDTEDLPLLGMLVHGTSTAEIVQTLDMSQTELRERQERMVAALRRPGDRVA